MISTIDTSVAKAPSSLTGAEAHDAAESPSVATIELPDGEPYDVTVADMIRMLDKAELSDDSPHVVWTGAKPAHTDPRLGNLYAPETLPAVASLA